MTAYAEMEADETRFMAQQRMHIPLGMHISMVIIKKRYAAFMEPSPFLLIACDYNTFFSDVNGKTEFFEKSLRSRCAAADAARKSSESAGIFALQTGETML